MSKKVYTKKGDTGWTSLLSGERVKKVDHRIEAVGTLDELNSFIGLLRSEMFTSDILEDVQWNLFNAGALVIDDKGTPNLPQLTEEDITQLEQQMDLMQEELPELKNFILPKGSKAVSLAHVCRTICRRAERIVNHTGNESISKYLNRLSDYFFVLARWIGHKQDVNETIWKND